MSIFILQNFRRCHTLGKKSQFGTTLKKCAVYITVPRSKVKSIFLRMGLNWKYISRQNHLYWTGPSLYYVSIVLTFLNPTHLISINIILNVSKTGQFLDPPTQSITDVIYRWSLSVICFSTKISHICHRKTDIRCRKNSTCCCLY